MDKGEKPRIDLSGLGDETLLDMVTDPEMDEELSDQAYEIIKQRQEQGIFSEELSEDEAEEEPGDDEYEEYEQRMQRIGSEVFRRKPGNPDAVARKERELDKQGRGKSLGRDGRNQELTNALSQAEGPTGIEKAPRTEAEILEKAEQQISHHAKRFAAEGFADALYDGVDTTPEDAILSGYSRHLWKIRQTNPEYNSSFQTMQHMLEIQSDIIPKCAEKLDEAAIAEARKEAYISAIHQGVLYEQDPSGQMVYRYTIPNEVVTNPEVLSGQIKKFVDRYGSEHAPRIVLSPEQFLRHNGIELDSDEVREQSYTGFRNIVEAIKDQDEPDTSKLEWYYNNLSYGNHIEDLVASLERYAESDEKAKTVIKRFLEQKSEYQDWLRENEEIDANDVFDSEYKVLDYSEEDIEQAADISALGETTKRAIDYIAQQWGINPEDIDPRIMSHIDRSGFLYDYIDRRSDDRPIVEPKSSIEEARKRELEKANSPFVDKDGETGGGKPEVKAAKREIWTEEEKEILAKAKIIALHYICQRIRETGVDPNAEILEPLEFSNNKYILLRFGCDGANHVIGESPKLDNSLYAWYGDGDRYREVFSADITKKEAKAKPGVRAFPHYGGFEGLHGTHDKVLDFFVQRGALTVDSKQLINNTAITAA